MTQELVETFKIGLGFAILFFPPLLIATLGYSIQRIKYLPHLLIISTPFLTILMMNLIPQAWAIFPFYNILLVGLVLIAKKYKMEIKESLPMAIYFVFSISVLWEIPIQIGILQNPNALAISTFKMIGVPLLFFWMYQRGWRLNGRFYGTLITTIIFGAGLAYFIDYKTIQTLFWLAHGYRLFWIVSIGAEVLSVLRNHEFLTKADNILKVSIHLNHNKKA